jgi:site-specific DNA-methyltransferase (adenine-specific)
MNEASLKAIFSQENGSWGTPVDLFQSLLEEFDFGVDVAATAENSCCGLFIDKEQDGLQTPWGDFLLPHQAAWCNPPYGRGIVNWIFKAVCEHRQGVTTVMLLPARTDTRWFHDLIWDESLCDTRRRIELRFLRGRLRFRGADNAAPFPSMIVVFWAFRDADRRAEERQVGG